MTAADQAIIPFAILAILEARPVNGAAPLLIRRELAAQDLDLSTKQVYEWLDRLQARGEAEPHTRCRWRRVKPEPAHPRGRPPGSRPLWLDEAVRLYTRDRLTATEIGEWVGASGTTVISWLRQAGVKIRRPGARRASLDPNRRGARRPPAWLPLAVRLYGEGQSCNSIGSQVGCSGSNVNAWLRYAGVQIRRPGVPYRGTRPEGTGMKLIIRETGGDAAVAIIEDYTGQVPRPGEYIFHPPLHDDGTQDLSSYGTHVMSVKTVTWGILARPANGEKHFTGRVAPMVEVWV